MASGSTLTFFGAIGDGSPSGGLGLTETGGGLLITAATASNTYTGTTTVNSGTFEMDQQWGSQAVQGPLVIGDGTDTAEVLNWQSNQFGPGVAVTLNGANATLKLNGLDDTVASLTFYGGTVTTGSTGTLTLGGDVTVDDSSTTATIGGNLDLGGADPDLLGRRRQHLKWDRPGCLGSRHRRRRDQGRGGDDALSRGTTPSARPTASRSRRAPYSVNAELEDQGRHARR